MDILMAISQLICRLRGKHTWRKQRKAEREADIATFARMAAVGDIKVTVLFGKICRRCGKIEAIKKRKQKSDPAAPGVDGGMK